MKKRYIITERILVTALIAIALCGCLGPLALGQFNLALLGVYLGVPMLAAPLLWLKLRNKSIEETIISQNLNSLLMLAFLICCLISILLLYLFPVRTISYYIVAALMGMLISAQILYSGEINSGKTKIILIQIVILYLNIIWGVSLKYYLFIGRTDILFHSSVIENLLDAGYISQSFEIYQAFPLWHILCAFIYRLLSLPVKPAEVMFITNGIIYGFLVLIVYLTASKLFNKKIALLSALFLCFHTDSIFYGMYSIPRSVVFFLEALLIFLLLQKKDYLTICLCVVLSIGLIIYHTASMPFIILIMAVFYIIQVFYHINKSKLLFSPNLLLLMIVSTLTYWMYAGVMVFESVAKSLVFKGPSGILTKSVVETPARELFNYLQYSPMLFFLIAGVLWALRSAKIKEEAKTFMITGLLLVPVSFPGPALLLNKLAGNFNFSRFGEYSFIFICIAGAAGLYVIFNRLGSRQRIFAVALTFIMAFLAVSNDFTASDNPLVKRPFYTFYLSEEESVSLDTVSQISPAYLMTDYISCRYLQGFESQGKINVLEVYDQKFLRYGIDDIIFIRLNELKNRPLQLFSAPSEEFIPDPSLGDSLDYYQIDLQLWNSLENCNIVYDSGGTKAYQ
ncbi:MAG: hypothetical protein ACOX7P_02785 [Oscillospiraceae bacterium]